MRKWQQIGIVIIIGVFIGGIIGFILLFEWPKSSPSDEEPEYEPPVGWQQPRIASNDYTQIYQYNQSIWADVFGSNTNPSELFGPNADKVLYQCKYYNKALQNISIDVFDFVECLYDVTFDVIQKENIKQAREEIGGEWDSWIITRDIWAFSNNSFSDEPDYANIKFPILQNPNEMSLVYEEIQALINYSFLSVENFTASEFIYKMMLKRFLFGRPVDSYLEELKGSLAPQNITLSKTTLIFSRKAKQKYFVYAEYHNQSSDLYGVTFFNKNNKQFYYLGLGSPPPLGSPNINSYNLIIVSGLVCIISVGIAYLNYKKRNRLI